MVVGYIEDDEVLLDAGPHSSRAVSFGQFGDLGEQRAGPPTDPRRETEVVEAVLLSVGADVGGVGRWAARAADRPEARRRGTPSRGVAGTAPAPNRQRETSAEPCCGIGGSRSREKVR